MMRTQVFLRLVLSSVNTLPGGPSEYWSLSLSVIEKKSFWCHPDDRCCDYISETPSRRYQIIIMLNIGNNIVLYEPVGVSSDNQKKKKKIA